MLGAGLPQGGMSLLLQGAMVVWISAAPPPAAAALAPELLGPSWEERTGNRSAVVLNPGVAPLPLHIVPNRAVEVRGHLSTNFLLFFLFFFFCCWLA